MRRKPVQGPYSAEARRDAALDLLPSGVGVFDAASRLVLCNKAFAELRSLPAPLCTPGTTLESIVRHIAARGDYGAGDTETLVRDRLAEIAANPNWEAEQHLPDGRRLLIRHTRTPEGGLMITYADVTEERGCAKVRSVTHSSARLLQKASMTGTSPTTRSLSRNG
jgi:PAS domain-containing protein